MSEVERNEICPCGSGKKYKKCCLAADEEITLQLFDDKRLMEAVEVKLLNFTESRQEFLNIKDEVGYALADYNHIDDISSLEQDEIEELLEDVAFFDWFKLDYKMENDKTLMQYFLEQSRETLLPEECVMADTLSNSYPSLYQILEVYPRRGFKFKNILSGQELHVYAKAEDLKDLSSAIFDARVIFYKDRYSLLDVGAVFPNEACDDLVKAIREYQEKWAQEEGRVVSMEDFLKAEGGWLFNGLYLGMMGLMDSELGEDDDFLVTKEYQVLDFEAAKKLLSSLPGAKDFTDEDDLISADWPIEQAVEGQEESEEYWNEIFLTNESLSLDCYPEVQELCQELLLKHFGNTIKPIDDSPIAS